MSLSAFCIVQVSVAAAGRVNVRGERISVRPHVRHEDFDFGDRLREVGQGRGKPIWMHMFT